MNPENRYPSGLRGGAPERGVHARGRRARHGHRCRRGPHHERCEPRLSARARRSSSSFCLVIDQGFKFTSQPMAEALNLSQSTVSLQATSRAC
ncbi:hypothetical protein QJS66_20810 [Kocuria rhizophila]|nr:hypothetical protein QJS66_20810 [Kocuria rhizophila]